MKASAIVLQAVIAIPALLFLASIWTNGESLAAHLASTGAVMLLWPLFAGLAEAIRGEGL